MAETYKTLAQVNPEITTLTDAYTATANTSVQATGLVIANRSATPTSFRVSIAIGGETDDLKQYLFYDTAILGNETLALTLSPIFLQPTDVIRVYSTLETLSFTLSGKETTP